MLVKNLVASALLPLLCAAPLWPQAAPASPSTEIRLGGLSHQLVPGFSPASLADGCTLVRSRPDRIEEERRDCAAPRPAVRGGAILEWLEAPGAISLYPATLRAGGPEPPPLLLGASATVRLPAADPADDPAATVELIQLDSFKASRYPQPDFRRRLTAADAARGVAMPAGLVMAAIRSRGGNLLARPQRAEPGAALELVAAAPAAGRADLLLTLGRNRPLRYYGRDHEVTIELRRGQGEPRRPDQLVASGERLIALFFDLPAGSWQLRAESPAYTLAETSVALRGGEAAVVHADLEPLPSLAVRLEMPPGLRHAPLLIEAFDLASGKKLAEIAGIDPRSERVELGFLAPAEVEVQLLADTWLFKEVADLRPRQDAEILFAPRPIAVSGLVSRGGRPFETHVLFSPGGRDKPESTRTDSGGRYETVLYRSGFYPVIFDMGEARAAFIREVMVPDAAAATLDFDLPGNDVRVVVVDAESQEAVPSPFIDVEVLGAESPVEGRRMRMSFVAGEDGALELPPLGGNQILVSASAPDYLRSPLQLHEVAQLGQRHELRILLERASATRTLTFVRPDGQPAAGLEVRAQDGLGVSTPLFEGFTDSRGELEVPAQADGLFLLWRDPAGWLASGIAVFLEEDPRFAGPIALGAGSQLVAQVTDRTGAAVAGSPLMIWSGGERIEGETLEFLHGATASDPYGYIRARGLPAAPVVLLAHGLGRKYSELETLATPVSWPWPAIVALEKVE